MKKIYLFFAFLAWMNVSIGQETEGKYFEIGLEIQQYPTGYLGGVRAEIGLAPHHALDFRIGYNGLDHKDFGVHDSEVGGGFGGSVGYRYYFKSEHQRWFLGIRTDFWFNEVDWKDIDETSDPEIITIGESNIIVLQPTAIFGYRWAINEHFAITPTAAFGAEVNVKTDGEDVGQGLILLWGLNLTYRF